MISPLGDEIVKGYTEIIVENLEDDIETLIERFLPINQDLFRAIYKKESKMEEKVMSVNFAKTELGMDGNEKCHLDVNFNASVEMKRPVGNVDYDMETEGRLFMTLVQKMGVEYGDYLNKKYGTKLEATMNLSFVDNTPLGEWAEYDYHIYKFLSEGLSDKDLMMAVMQDAKGGLNPKIVRERIIKLKENK